MGILEGNISVKKRGVSLAGKNSFGQKKTVKSWSGFIFAPALESSLNDPINAIILKSWEFKDIKYDMKSISLIGPNPFNSPQTLTME